MPNPHTYTSAPRPLQLTTLHVMKARLEAAVVAAQAEMDRLEAIDAAERMAALLMEEEAAEAG